MIEQLLEQFFEHLRYERNVSEHTLRNYMSDLLQFLDYLAPADGQTGLRREVDIRQIDHITIREWLSSLHAAQKKKTSVARKLAALRTFFQFLVREGVVEMNPAKLVSSPRLEKKLPNHLSIEDAVRFIETPDTETDLGRRDRAILELLYATGVRVSELTRLDIGDIDFRGKLLRVTGKRRKQRIVPFGDPALHTLLNYLTVRNNFLQHAPLAERETDALFLNYQGEALSTRGVQKMLAKYLKAAGITKKISPHSLRHTFATYKAERGVSPYVLREWLGHARLDTTQIYVHMARENTKKAMEATSL